MQELPEWLHSEYEELWRGIPEHMHGAVDRYVSRGIPPGSFLTAVLENDLRMAVWKADHVNVNAIQNYVAFLSSAVPAICWGSETNVEHWIERGGFAGRGEAA